jgi:hypothetical protein
MNVQDADTAWLVDELRSRGYVCRTAAAEVIRLKELTDLQDEVAEVRTEVEDLEDRVFSD